MMNPRRGRGRSTGPVKTCDKRAPVMVELARRASLTSRLQARARPRKAVEERPVRRGTRERVRPCWAPRGFPQPHSRALRVSRPSPRSRDANRARVSQRGDVRRARRPAAHRYAGDCSLPLLILYSCSDRRPCLLRSSVAGALQLGRAISASVPLGPLRGCGGAGETA